MTNSNILGPFVAEAAREGQQRRYVVTRHIQTDSGIITQALSVTGEWVDRPEAFEFDDEVLLKTAG
ncbi:hypothetical protein ACIQW5_10445 [Methylorubrum thiocyanatum]|uniref:hypothetical protein n=1 Tax=Methylorubrum thiocyanatum TaxID=47958 RepID=UPI00383B95D8